MDNSAPYVTHFMRRGQVFLLRKYFPSIEAFELALNTCFDDATHQLMREQQESRILDAQIAKLRHNLPFDI